MVEIFKAGGILFIISGIVVFGSDTLFKRGKISTLKELLIIKVSGLLITIVSMIMMIYGKN